MWQWSQWQYCLGRHVPLMKSSWPFRSCDNKNRENVTLVFKCRSSLTRARIFQQLNFDKSREILVAPVQPAFFSNDCPQNSRYFQVLSGLMNRSRHLEVVLRSEMRSFYGIYLVMNHGFYPLSCMTLELDHKCYFFKWSWYILIKTSNMLCKSIHSRVALFPSNSLLIVPSPTKRNIPRCHTIKIF